MGCPLGGEVPSVPWDSYSSLGHCYFLSLFAALYVFLSKALCSSKFIFYIQQKIPIRLYHFSFFDFKDRKFGLLLPIRVFIQN